MCVKKKERNGIFGWMRKKIWNIKEFGDDKEDEEQKSDLEGCHRDIMGLRIVTSSRKGKLESKHKRKKRIFYFPYMQHIFFCKHYIRNVSGSLKYH